MRKKYKTQKEWKEKNKDRCAEYNRKSNLKINYGISLEEYNNILNKQNGGCALCGMTQEESLKIDGRHLCVDHCHNTGINRGILCSNCNRGLGLLKDNVDIFKNAIEYLEKQS